MLQDIIFSHKLCSQQLAESFDISK